MLKVIQEIEKNAYSYIKTRPFDMRNNEISMTNRSGDYRYRLQVTSSHLDITTLFESGVRETGLIFKSNKVLHKRLTSLYWKLRDMATNIDIQKALGLDLPEDERHLLGPELDKLIINPNNPNYIVGNRYVYELCPEGINYRGIMKPRDFTHVLGNFNYDLRIEKAREIYFNKELREKLFLEEPRILGLGGRMRLNRTLVYDTMAGLRYIKSNGETITIPITKAHKKAFDKIYARKHHQDINTVLLKWNNGIR